MLILTRRVGETIVIGDNVTFTVLGVKGNQVRLGANAPKEVSIHREESVPRGYILFKINNNSQLFLRWKTRPSVIALQEEIANCL